MCICSILASLAKTFLNLNKIIKPQIQQSTSNRRKVEKTTPKHIITNLLKKVTKGKEAVYPHYKIKAVIQAEVNDKEIWIYTKE